MSVPKVSTIRAAFDVNDHMAEAMRLMMKSADNHDAVDKVLDCCNKILEGYGVEDIRGKDWVPYYLDIALLYVNMGDTYTPTIIYDCVKERWHCCSWGDIVESDPKRFEI